MTIFFQKITKSLLDYVCDIFELHYFCLAYRLNKTFLKQKVLTFRVTFWSSAPTRLLSFASVGAASTFVFTVQERSERFVNSRRGRSDGFCRTCASGTEGWSVGCGRASGWEKGDLCRCSASPFPDTYQSYEGVGTLLDRTETRNIWWSRWKILLIFTIPHCPKWKWLESLKLFQGIGVEEKFSGDAAIGSCPMVCKTFPISCIDRNLYNRNFSLFVKLPWPGDNEKNLRCSSEVVHSSICLQHMAKASHNTF